MGRIENAVFEDGVADSLVGPETEQAEQQPAYFGDSVELLNQEIEDQQNDVERYGDAEMESRKPAQREEEAPEREPQEAHEAQQEQPEEQEQAYVPPTAAQVEEGIARLDAVVQQHGLDDAASAKDLASGFCEAFGTDLYQSGVDVKAIGSVMSKAALSAAQVYDAAGGDLSRIPPMPDASVKAFSHDIMRGLGLDPRTTQVNERLLAETVMRGSLTFLHTYQSYGGKVNDLAKLNEPQAAEQFLGNFLQAFGIKGPVDRATALKFADAGGKYLLSFMGKLQQIQPPAPEKRTATRGQRIPAKFREGIKGAKVPTFRTNQDIFNSGALQYREKHQLL